MESSLQLSRLEVVYVTIVSPIDQQTKGKPGVNEGVFLVKAKQKQLQCGKYLPDPQLKWGQKAQLSEIFISH